MSKKESDRKEKRTYIRKIGRKRFEVWFGSHAFHFSSLELARIYCLQCKIARELGIDDEHEEYEK